MEFHLLIFNVSSQLPVILYKLLQYTVGPLNGLQLNCSNQAIDAWVDLLNHSHRPRSPKWIYVCYQYEFSRFVVPRWTWSFLPSLESLKVFRLVSSVPSKCEALNRIDEAIEEGSYKWSKPLLRQSQQLQSRLLYYCC